MSPDYLNVITTFAAEPYIDGVRINSPHYLCKIMQSTAGVHRYTLVVSQFEKLNSIYYTLRAYSTCPFELKKISNPYKFKEEVNLHSIVNNHQNFSLADCCSFLNVESSIFVCR